MVLASRLRSRHERKRSQQIHALASLPQPSDAPREIQAATIATIEELPTEVVLERARLVSEAPARMPYIGIYGKYNKRWYVDIVTLPDNAIRCLVSAAFELIGAAHRLALDMTVPDFDQLFAFLSEFDHFIRVIFDSEEKVLYPEMEHALKKRADYSTFALHPSSRAATRAHVHALLNQLTDEELRHTPSVTAIRLLQQTMDSLSTQLLDYFNVKECTLPRVFFRSFRGCKEKNRMETRLIRYFEDANNEYYYSALLTLPLNNEQVRLDFEERHFARQNKRESYRHAVNAVQGTLLAIPRRFEQAARSYEQRFSVKTFVEKYGTDRDQHATTQLVDEKGASPPRAPIASSAAAS
ncbi:hypothetical protein BWQ96_04338 [Gracilariopsis chorda]|uniref:Uncharacterized protein n=1 Tax=Gracilariopsis chorda TaxID=448386 RepID=A0A2V3IUV9_9FLOR|nr:hypothetical protein BWQ96_04338 [Gracilariopsis chorda]|eukprot:PXF45903.1 hypothetical protein BWQ96_04338 [Gracilariopsis chorda]